MRYFLFLLPLILLGKEISLEWLSGKPTSVAKDYYIWRYLHQDINCSQATQAIQQAKSVNRKLFFAYANDCSGPIQRIATCMKMSAKELLDQDPACAAAGINSYKLSTLPKEKIALLLEKTSAFHLPKAYRLYLKEHPTPKDLLYLFNNSSKNYRKKLDRYLTPKEIEEISGHWRFKTFVKRVVLSDEYPKLAYSLLLTQAKNIDPNTSFLLAMNALKFKLPYIALDFLNRAKDAYYKEDIDKANFWIYRIKGDKKSLKNVADSWDINIYSILAKEKLGQKLSYVIPEAKSKRGDINLSDPFFWNRFLQEHGKKEEYFYTDTIALYAYLLEKESKYKIHPYILPYHQELDDLNTSRRALIYALARQESRFIPGAISHSFALGMMQFMPFLAKATAKKLQLQNFNLDMMFDPKVALRFANDHLDYLETKLATPLFIAYGYNGGIGFTKRLALPLFCKYDPFLAMELVPYSESRKYGKKVLANYYVYKEILNEPFSIWNYFERLQNMRRSFCEKE